MSTNKWKPNFFMVPNAFVDEVMAKLPDSAVKMYLLIIRKTKGWDKECDSISLTQFMKFTGKSKPTVTGAMSFLVKANLVIEHESTRFGNTYSINDDSYDCYVLLTASKEILLVKNFYPTSKKILLPLVKNFYSQKKLSKKTKTIKKGVSFKKRNSKAVSHDSKLNLNLSDKQIDYFANLLANDPNFGSTHAVIGESGKEFAARIKQMMKDPNWVAEHMDDLKAVGFGGAA